MGSNGKSTDKKDYYLNIRITREMGEGLADGYEYVAEPDQVPGMQKSIWIRQKVTGDVYRAYLRPLWRENKRAQRLVENRKKRELAQAECRVDKTIKEMDNAVSFDDLDENEYRFKDKLLTPSLETIAEKEEQKKALHKELARLKDIVDRTILEMFSYGYSEAEIGRAVGLSQKAVNKRKHRLFDSLRERLKDYR